MKNKYIGIFDSGFGGLSVLKYCINNMPNENYIYVSDSINAPFGTKNKDELISIADGIIAKLMQYELKEIIVACGTMSTNIIDILKCKYPMVHFIGTYPDFERELKPGLVLSEKKINFNTNGILKIKKHTLKILLIATTATCKSEYVNDKYETFKNIFDVYIEPADPIVRFVEKDELDTFAFRNYLSDLFKEYKDIDYLVLGCTHFPFAIPMIREILSDKVRIISGCENAAIDAKKYLEQLDLLENQNAIDVNKIQDMAKSEIKIIDTNKNNDREKQFIKLLNLDECKYDITFI